MNVAVAATLLDGSGTRKRPRTPINRLSHFEPMAVAVRLARANSVAKNFADFAATILTVRTSPTAALPLLVLAPTSIVADVAYFTIPGTLAPGTYSYDVFVLDGSANAYFITEPADLVIYETDGRPGDPVNAPGPAMLLVGIPVPGPSDVGKFVKLLDDAPATLAFASAGGSGGSGALRTGVLTFTSLDVNDYQDVSLAGLSLTDGGYVVSLTVFSDPAEPVVTPRMVPRAGDAAYPAGPAGGGFRVQLVDQANCKILWSVFEAVA